MKAYKAFNKDLTCRGFQFKEGETFEHYGDFEICKSGFHFCKDLALTLEHYPQEILTINAYAEVEILGEIKYEDITKHKGCTNKIKIVKVFSDEEILKIFDKKNNSVNWNSGDSNSGDSNSGNWNSGDSNSGDRNSGNSNSGDRNSGNSNSDDSNSGNRNSGNRNSGNRNSGNRNSGDWNSGNWNSINNETGMFNSKQLKTIRVFNKLCTIKRWENANKPNFLYFDLIAGKSYKESFQESFKNANREDIELLKKLPNFNKKVFFEISGIKIN